MDAEATAPRRRTGRRAGPTVSNQRILEIARGQFSRHGYEGTTMRTIAQEAGVDSALIHHFFLTKEGLFAAAVNGALSPPDLVDRVLDGPRGHVGERTVRVFLEFWDDPEINVRLVGLLRSMTVLSGAAEAVRDFLSNAVLRRLVAALGSANPELRAALTGAQLVGLATLRYIYRAEPVTSLSPADLAARTRRTFQTTLVGAL